MLSESLNLRTEKSEILCNVLRLVCSLSLGKIPDKFFCSLKIKEKNLISEIN